MNDIQETCQKNATSALLVGRKDLVQVFSIPFVGDLDFSLGAGSFHFIVVV